MTVSVTPAPVFNPTTGVWSPAVFVAGVIPTLTLAQVAAVFTAKGGILVGTGAGTGAILAVGADTDQITADSTQPDGVKWAAA